MRNKKVFSMLSFAISMILCFSLTVSTNAAFQIHNTSADAFVNERDVPEMISMESVTGLKHIARLYEKEASNSLDTVLFQNLDGTYSKYIFSENIKYTDETGKVRDKTNKLIYDKNGNYMTADNDVVSVFPTDITDGITLSYKNYSLRICPMSSKAKSSGAVLEASGKRGASDSVVYPGVFNENAYLKYTVGYSGFKEDIVLNEFPGMFEFGFTVYTKGLYLKSDKSGACFTNSEGKAIINVGNVDVYDSAGKHSQGNIFIKTSGTVKNIPCMCKRIMGFFQMKKRCIR